MPRFYRNSLHPTAIYVDDADLKVAAFDIAEFGEELRAICTDATRARLSLPSGTEPPKGWREIKETRLRNVPVDEILPRETSASVVPEGGPDWRDLVRAHDRYYRATHFDNPVADLSFDEMQEVFTGEDLSKNCAFAVLEEGAIRSFGSLRDIGVADRRAEVGWVGATDLQDGFGIAEVLNAIFRAAVQHGLSHVEIEADSTHPALWEYVDKLPSIGEDRFTKWERSVSSILQSTS